jgi:hypothetical protein
MLLEALNWQWPRLLAMPIALGKPCVYFSCFFYLLQVEKVPILESTAYLKKEIPSTF